MALFTPEELAELERVDAEIDDNFRQTAEEIAESRRRDRSVIYDRKDRKSKKIADQQRAWVTQNREKWNAYQREYRKRKKSRSPDGSPGNSTKDMNVS